MTPVGKPWHLWDTLGGCGRDGVWVRAPRVRHGSFSWKTAPLGHLLALGGQCHLWGGCDTCGGAMAPEGEPGHSCLRGSTPPRQGTHHSLPTVSPDPTVDPAEGTAPQGKLGSQFGLELDHRRGTVLTPQPGSAMGLPLSVMPAAPGAFQVTPEQCAVTRMAPCPEDSGWTLGFVVLMEINTQLQNPDALLPSAPAAQDHS